MSATPTIVAIVRDPALLRALAFALRTHGHEVTTHRSWASARESVGGARCVILDGCISPADREDCLASLGLGTPVLLLAEDDTAFIDRPSLQVLHKPLTGTDVVAAVSAIRRNP